MSDTSVADTKAPSSADLVGGGDSAPAGGDGGSGGATDAPFWNGFQNAEVKGWAEKAGFKSAEELADRARKFDAFKDADPATLVKLPGADAKPEEYMALLERMGVPKDAAEYKLTEIEGVDKDTAGWFQSVAREAGIMPWQARLIAEKQMAFMAEGNNKLIEEDRVNATRELAQVKDEWRQDFTQRQEGVRRVINYAARQAGMSADETKAALSYLESGTGLRGVYKMFDALSKFVREGDFVDGGQAGPESQAVGAGLLSSYQQTHAQLRK